MTGDAADTGAGGLGTISGVDGNGGGGGLHHDLVTNEKRVLYYIDQ